MMSASDVQTEGPQVAQPEDTRPHMSNDIGRRDRKKHATRRSLRSAALRLVAERGFAHVTVEDITEAADVSVRTFFNYFSSKESAVIGADPERIAQMRTNLIARPVDEPPIEALRAVLVEYATAIADELDDLGEGREAWFRRLCIVREDRDLLGAFVAHISEVERGLVGALAERLGKDPALDPYPALVTATAFAAARVAALYWSANGGVGSLPDLTGAAIDCLANGLAEGAALHVTPAPLRPLRQSGGPTRSKGPVRGPGETNEVDTGK
jgi:AcrR family transcriptional regulator